MRSTRRAKNREVFRETDIKTTYSDTKTKLNRNIE
jgi:hypothetical protein